ncbi:MAG: hypothetical protein DCF20_04800 [Pseudanabaena sp.]|nr:MAG: hypothetical protein DCF20_04800 [Pseudanabaena sp.]
MIFFEILTMLCTVKAKIKLIVKKFYFSPYCKNNLPLEEQIAATKKKPPTGSFFLTFLELTRW